MKPEQLQAIRERVAKATPGPWLRVTLLEGAGVMAGELWVVRFDDDYGTGPAQSHDSLFIAHAREDVPALLAEVERPMAQLQVADMLDAAVEFYINETPSLALAEAHAAYRAAREG